MGLAGPKCIPEQPLPLCSGCSSCPVHLLPTWAQELCRDTLGAKEHWERGSHTCSLGHYHLGFAASAIAFHSVGGYSDGVGGLRLQVCDDHLLQAGVGSVMRPALSTLLPGLGSNKVDVGSGPQAETCTRPHAETPTGSRSMLRWSHAAWLEQGSSLCPSNLASTPIPRVCPPCSSQQRGPVSM